MGEKITNTQQQTPQPAPVSQIIDVDGTQISRQDLINQVEGQYANFFNTYKDQWSKKQQQQILDQKNAIVNNIQNGNITKINNGSIDIADVENSGIDTSMGGAGQVNIGYLSKIGHWMSDQVKANTPHKAFDQNTLNTSWINNFFGGSDNPDYQSWMDLDPADNNGKRGTSGRIQALNNWLNSIDINSYTEANPNLGSLEDVKNKFTRLRTALSDGQLNNEDYAAAAALGLDLRTMLADNIGSANGSSDTGQQTSQQILQEAWDGGNKQQMYDELANRIRGWQSNDDVTINVGRAKYGANDYLKFRNLNDKTKVYNNTDANSMVNYYSTNFFPKFFKQFKTETFSPRYLASHANELVNTWQGRENKLQYIAQNLTLAIRNKLYSKGSLLGSYVTQLNQVLDNTGNPTGFWTIPESFNEDTGTEYIYNPDTGEFKSISIRNPKYSYLMKDYLIGNGVNLSQQTTSQKNGGKIEKHQYGGNLFNQEQSQGSVNLSSLMAPTPQQIAAQKQQQQQAAQQKKQAAQQKFEVDKRAQHDKFWQGNQGKEFHSLEEFQNALTPQDKRELGAAALDVTSIIANLAGAATAAPTMGIGAAVGGVTSAATGLAAAGLRAYNKAADGDFTLGDVGTTAIDAGLSLAGLIPGIGAAAKTGSLAARLGKVAHIVLAGLGVASLGSAAAGAKRAATSIIEGKMPSTSDFQDFATALTAISGSVSHRAATHVRNKMTENALQSGRITRANEATPESWTYKFNVKGDNNTLVPQQVTLKSKQEVQNLVDALVNKNSDKVLGVIKNADSKFSNLQTDRLSYNPLSVKEKGVSKLSNITGKTPKSLENAGLFYNKPTSAGIQYLKYENPSNIEQRLWNTSVGIGELGPKNGLRNLRDVMFGRNRQNIIDDYFANQVKPTTKTPKPTEATPKPEGTPAAPVAEPEPVIKPVVEPAAPVVEPVVTPKVEAKPTKSAEQLQYEEMLSKMSKGDIKPTTTESDQIILPKEVVDQLLNGKPKEGQLAGALLDPVRSKIQSLFIPGQDVNRQNLADFVNNNKVLYNKLPKEDKEFIDNLVNKGLFDQASPEAERKHLLEVVNKMVTPKQGVTWRKKALDANMQALSMIRYGKGGILKAQSGSKFQPQVFGKDKDRTTYGGITNTNNNTTWYNNVFNPYQDYIVGQLRTYGSDDQYGNWLNNMQHEHYGLYQSAGGQNGNFLNQAYNNNAETTKKYQSAYDSDSLSKNPTSHGYNTRGIAEASSAGRYKNVGYETRNGQDSLNTDWTPDGSYSGQTDDRRILGRLGDFTDKQLTDWNNKLHGVGWEQYLDKDNYYKLRRWNNPNNTTLNGVDVANGPHKSTVLNDIANVINNNKPAILGALRTGWDNRFNNKQLNQYLQHLNPVLYDPWTFNRRIYGDYATMNEYQRQGANAQLQANRIASNTADSYLGAATQMEGNKNASEANIKGRLADNQMIRETYEKALAENKANLERLNTVSNQNKLNLNNNERERAQAILSTNKMNHDNWSRWIQGYVELPAAQEAKERKAMQNYLDFASLNQEQDAETNRQLKAIRNKYYDRYYDPNISDTERAKIGQQMSDEITQLQLDRQRAKLASIAQLRNLRYSYTPSWNPSGSYKPATATPSYNKKGGSIYDLGITSVKEKNKDNERLSKQWQKELEKFWNQYGKLRQADYAKMIKLK